MTDRRRWWALALLCMSSIVIPLDTLILSVALPTLVRELQASTADLQWIVDSYLLVFAGLLLVGGSLGDRFGRAAMLRIGLVVFGVASALATWSDSVFMLVACRALMGVGGALILPATLSIVSNLFIEPRERGRAIGMWSTSAGLGLAIGPVVGGLLLSQFWWGSVFLVNVPITVVSFLLSWWLIPESKDPEVSRFDPLGVVLSILGVSAVVWATIQAPIQGWGSLATLGSFVAAIGVLGCFVVWELRCAHPMLELGFFRNPRFSVANLAGIVSNFTFVGTVFLLTLLLQDVYGYSALAAGIRLIPLAAMFMVMGFVAPRLAERFGTKRTVAVGLFVFAFGMLVLVAIDEHSSYAMVLVAMLIIGTGYGLVISPSTEAVMGALPREKAGLGSGTNNTTKQMGTAFGVAVFGSLLVSGYQSVLARRTSSLGLTPNALRDARASLSDALVVASDLGGSTGRALAEGARAGFIHGMHMSVSVGVGVLVLGAILSFRYLPARAPHLPESLERLAVAESVAL